ncbi:tetratricopeptide repeat protein [Rufibacter quisquiliarum]|uniref:Tetratricopeptide (TPR) repeat protein n=1 Tax=Rufibacter quisquiliarum TaxID=1549639 RepID=A0A839GRI7_9BACT|nr:tetratricopeptide repeat protein [Rufibacter quisquiliarum]MBA9079469.1 tetratricopeptide (TPR) repeat protein [Rufibacter quisquiliarum]
MIPVLDMPYSLPRLLNLRLLPFLFLLLLFSGCTLSRLAKKAERGQKLWAQPEVLMVRGRQVPVEVTAQLPKNLLRDDYQYGIRVYYKADKGVEDHIGSLAFDFGNYNFVEGRPTMSSSFTLPYTPSKITGKLYAQGVVTSPKGRKKYLKPVVLAPGIRTTPYLVQHVHSPAYVSDSAKKEKPGPLKIPIFFDQALATLRTGLGTNLQLLDQFLTSNQKTKQIEILATHSPDSLETTTRNLASRRAVAVENFIKKKIDTESYTNTVSSVRFNLRTIQKNWQAFLGRVQNSALPEEQIQQILDIVNGPGSFIEKERKLQELASYEYIEMYVYPVLRYAEVTIDYQPNLRRDYEVYLLAKKIVENRVNADALNAEEMQYAAGLTPLLAEKKKIYESAIENYMTWQALNNLGMVYFEQAQKELKPAARQHLLESAILNFRYAAHRQPTAQLFYNLGVAHHQHGDALEALQSFDYAVKLGGPMPVLQQLFTDKAALELEVGQYDDAARSLAYAGSGYAAQFNRTMLYLLKENYDGAAQLGQKLLETFPADASTHYLMAIIYARNQQEAQMADHLKKAVAAKPALAQKAIEDLEFQRYHQSAAFAGALKI